MVATGEVLEDAIVTDTDSDERYPNYALQQWEIITDENQVNIWFQSKNTHMLLFTVTKPYMLYFIG